MTCRALSIASLGWSVATSATACGDSDTQPRQPAAIVDYACPFAPDHVGYGPVDGLTAAARKLESAISALQDTFAADANALASLYGLPLESGHPVSLDAIVTAIRNDVDANTQAGLVATVLDVTCAANDDVATLAESTCERDSGCDPAGSACAERGQCVETGRLNGLAALTCTVPLVDITFSLKPGLTGDAESQFYARMDALEKHATSMLAGRALASALVVGKMDEQVLVDRAPALEIRDGIVRVESGPAIDAPKLPAECSTYVVPSLSESAESVLRVSTDANWVLSEGKKLASLFR